MNTQLLLGIWAAIFVGYAAITVVRRSLGKREDDHLHVSDFDGQAISTQVAVAHKLDVLDRWKTTLLVLAILVGVLIGALQIWRAWTMSVNTLQIS